MSAGAGEHTLTLPASAGVVAYDRDECTVTIALDTEAETLDLRDKLPYRNRVRLCDDAGIPTDQLSTLMGEVRGVVAQYRDDLRRPPTGDSAERRLAAITTLLAKLGSGS